MLKKISKIINMIMLGYLKIFSLTEIIEMANLTKVTALKKCTVVGLSHYNYKMVKPYLKVDDEVIVKREINNMYDRYALSVHFNSYMMGYISKRDNKKVIPGKYKIKSFNDTYLTIERSF